MDPYVSSINHLKEVLSNVTHHLDDRVTLLKSSPDSVGDLNPTETKLIGYLESYVDTRVNTHLIGSGK